MLDEIPHEIILAISSFLTFKDKLILITTCRRLFNLISNTNLYSELCLIGRKKGTMDVIEKFKDKPSFGAQVKFLSIKLNSISDQLLVQLPTIFPNITQFIGHFYYFERSMYHPNYSICPIIKWSNTLKTYDMGTDFPGILPVLKTTTFPRLTNLNLMNESLFEDASKLFDFNCFLPMVRNAPSLKHLELNTSINLEFLEELHSSCLYLESLTLTDPEVVIKNDTLPRPIVPADRLLYLDVSFAHCFDKKGLFLDYITAKYRCLNQLSISFQQNLDNEHFDSYFIPKDVSFEDMGLDENELEARAEEYESLRVEFEATRLVYKESGPRFFSNLTKSVKRIFICCDTFMNPVLALNHARLEPIYLDFCEVMNYASQMQYIRDIKSLKTLAVHAQYLQEIESHDILSTSVNRLEIQGTSGAIPIHRLLSVFPSLEDLGLFWMAKLTVTENNLMQRFPNLTSLDFSWGTMDQKCLDFLKMTAPNIQFMRIWSNYAIAPSPPEIDVDISEWDLKQLNMPCGCQPCYFYIITESVTELIKYDPIKKRLAIVEDGAPSSKHKKMANIVTSKEKRFKLNGIPVSVSHNSITFF